MSQETVILSSTVLFGGLIRFRLLPAGIIRGISLLVHGLYLVKEHNGKFDVRVTVHS